MSAAVLAAYSASLHSCKRAAQNKVLRHMVFTVTSLLVCSSCAAGVSVLFECAFKRTSFRGCFTHAMLLSGKAIMNASNAAPECDRIAIVLQNVKMPDLAFVKKHERCHDVVGV